MYARALAANFSIITLLNAFTGHVHSLTSSLKFSRTLELVGKMTLHAPSYIQRLHRQVLHEFLASAQHALQVESPNTEGCFLILKIHTLGH